MLVAAVLGLPTVLAGAPDAAPRQVYAQPSPLASLVAGLADAPVDARYALAVLVVERLISAYESELDQVMQERRRDPAAQRKLTRWHQAAAPVLSELRLAQASLYAAREVELHAGRHDQVVLLIDRRPLWVAWPRVTAQGQLERELVAEFCRRYSCPVDGTAGFQTPVPTPSAPQGSWVLSQGRPPAWETPQGLRCEFADLSARAAKEADCRAVVHDLYVLAAALRAASRGGERIAWEHVALHTDPAGSRQRVTVNERGDFVAAAVPALTAAQVDWEVARRWLQAQVQGRPVPATVIRAGRGD